MNRCTYNAKLKADIYSRPVSIPEGYTVEAGKEQNGIWESELGIWRLDAGTTDFKN